MSPIFEQVLKAVQERDLADNENRRYYGEGFIEGFKAAREQAAQACDRYAKPRPEYLDVSAYNLAIEIRALGTESEAPDGQ